MKSAATLLESNLAGTLCLDAGAAAAGASSGALCCVFDIIVWDGR